MHNLTWLASNRKEVDLIIYIFEQVIEKFGKVIVSVQAAILDNNHGSFSSALNIIEILKWHIFESW